jgi:hypothetical protein
VTTDNRRGGQFYFHHRAGNCVGLDLEGRQLGSAVDALSHAYVMVLEKTLSLRGRGGLASHSIEVTDAAGAKLFELAFTAVVDANTPCAALSEPSRRSLG